MLVDVQVSSINTSFSTFMTVCASLHASRAACTSSRSRSLACRVFFEGETPFVQLVPQGANLNRTTLLRQPFLYLSQSKIRLGCDPGAQHRFHFHQPGPAMAADRKTGAHSRLLLPASHLINPNAAHLEAPRNLRRTIPALQGSQHALPQIPRIGLHLRLPSTSRKYYRMKCIYLNRKRFSDTFGQSVPGKTNNLQRQEIDSRKTCFRPDRHPNFLRLLSRPIRSHDR